MIIDLREIPVIWINLDSATKNAEAMENKFKNYGFKNTIRKSARVIEPPEGTPKTIYHYVGCGQSHLDILKDKNLNTPFLILEDDAEFTSDFNPIIEIPDDADGIYLGVSHGNIYYKTKKYNENYLRISGILATHAILYISENYKNNMAMANKHFIYNLKTPWDVAAAGLQHRFRVYTPNNPFFYQADERDSANKWQFFTDKPLENRDSEDL